MALVDIVTKGSTDRSVPVLVINTDGTPATDAAYNSAGIDLWYRREGGSRVAITEATQTVNGAHADGGFVHVSDGDCRLDLPDAAFASGANYVDYGGTMTGKIVRGGRVRLIDVNLEDSVRAGMSALPNAAAQASGGLFTIGTGAGQVTQDANGRLNVNVAAISGDATAADNLEAYCDGTTPQPVNVTQFGGTNATASGGIPSVNVAQWRGTQPNTLQSGRLDAYVGAFAAGVIDAASIAADAFTAAKFATDFGTEVANAVGALVIETEGSYTLKNFASIGLAVLAGETSNGGTTLSTPNGNATRVSATTDGSNNRTAMTLTPSA